MKRYEKNEKEVLQSYFKMHEDYFKKNDDGLIPEGLNEMGWSTNAIWSFDKEISDIVNPFLDKMKKDLRMKDIPHISVTKIFEFDAAHFLPYHNRRCKYLHGHCWKLEVTYTDYPNPETGMVLDYTDLKHKVNEVLDEFDHGFVNLHVPYPTSEMMLLYFWSKLEPSLPKLEKLRLYETADSYAELNRDDVEWARC